MTDKPEIILFEGPGAERLAPLALTRPVFDLIVGARTLRERLEAVSGQVVARARLRPALTPLLAEQGLAELAGDAADGALFVNATWLADAPGWEAAESLAAGEALRASEGELVALRAGQGRNPRAMIESPQVSELKAVATRPLPGARLLSHPWQLIGWQEEALSADVRELAEASAPSCRAIQTRADQGVHVRGDEVWAEEGAIIEGPCALDGRNGPVLIRRDGYVGPFTHLQGPVCVAQGARLLGGRIAGSYIGPGCVIRGEVAASVFLGWANKAHDGFIGHSYIGEWVNLGALTTTSNLKNTYGTVRFWEEGAFRDTGMTKLGSLIGDHTKTAIGTMLATGCHVGAGVNLFGSGGLTPRWIPSFLWGVGPQAAFCEWERFISTAEAVLSRRERRVTPGARAVLQSVYEATAPERREWLGEREPD